MLPNDKLSTNFKFHEATDSSTAMRAGIDNVPEDQAIIDALIHTALHMEPVRTFLGHPIHIDSWYRCEELERILCEKDYKRWCRDHDHLVTEESWKLYFARKGHPKGFAVDFICPAFGTPQQIVEALKKSGIKYDQLIMEGTWVHISFKEPMRGESLVATFVKGEPTYTKDA